MQVLVNKGLVKAIGVSNFNSKQIQRLLDLDLKHKPVTNQVLDIRMEFCFPEVPYIDETFLPFW